MAFDTYKALLQQDDGKISGTRTVIAGFGAGITESLLAVTPFESIKTTLSVVSLAISSLHHMPAFMVTAAAESRHGMSIESMTKNPHALECEVFCTARASSSANVAYGASSRDLFPRQHARPPTQRPDLVATPH